VEAVGQLYDRHHTRIFRYLVSRLRDRQVAEDLTGEVFARMVRDLTKYQPRGVPFQSWLYRIAHNLAVDHRRVQGRRKLVPLFVAENAQSSDHNLEAQIEQKLTLERVADALETLQPSQQEVVVMRFLIGLSLREVAAVLDKTIPAVKSAQHRGLVALRAALQERQAAKGVGPARGAGPRGEDDG
jgi:RNA polymerase sigma-70 factor (ECF subfamily)